MASPAPPAPRQAPSAIPPAMAGRDEAVGPLLAAAPRARRLGGGHRRGTPVDDGRGERSDHEGDRRRDEPEDPEADAGTVDVVDDRVAAPEPLAARGRRGRRPAPATRGLALVGLLGAGGAAPAPGASPSGGTSRDRWEHGHLVGVAHRLVGLARLAVAPDGAVLEEGAERRRRSGRARRRGRPPRWRPAARHARCRPPRGPRRTVAARPTVTSSESANAAASVATPPSGATQPNVRGRSRRPG